MTVTVDLLRAWFRQFNGECFGGELPMPPIVLSKARTRLGTMACRRTWRWGKWVYTDFVIRISVYYDCPEREFQQTLLHEMIHYYIAYHQITDTSPHGKLFHELMSRINRDHGWHITVSSSVRGLRPAEACGVRPRENYVVLALVMRSGERMLSVVSPRSARKIDLMARMVDDIVDHRWYVSQDGYFSDFPKVRSLRARRVTPELYEQKTAAMQPLVFKQ